MIDQHRYFVVNRSRFLADCAVGAPKSRLLSMFNAMHAATVRKLVTTACMAVIAAATLVFSDDARALPASGAAHGLVESRTLLVRDGCGRGMRYSNRRDTCVEDFDRDRGFDRGRGFRDAPRRNFRDECGRGMRFSNSRQRCVFIDGDRGGRDDGAAAAAAAVGIIGAIVGSGHRERGDQRRSDGPRHQGDGSQRPGNR